MRATTPFPVYVTDDKQIANDEYPTEHPTIDPNRTHCDPTLA